MSHRIISVLIGIAIIAAVGPAAAAPTITWTPGSVSEVVGQGQKRTISASFIASENLTNLSVRVVPQLEPFIQVSPSAFASVGHGQTININITIAAASNSPLGTFAGTLQLRRGVDPKNTFAKPLPVTVEVWQQFIGPNFSFLYPPGWAITGPEQGLSLVSPTRAVILQLPDEVETPPEISVSTLANISVADLVSFTNAYDDGWFTTYSSVASTTVGERPALHFRDIGAAVGHAPFEAVFVSVDSSIVLFTLNDYGGSERDVQLDIFDKILWTVRF